MKFLRSERCTQYREISFEKGWAYVQKGVTKLIRIIEGEPEPIFNCAQYMEVYTAIYDMCTRKVGYVHRLNDKYREVIVDYTEKMVLPSLREKHGEDMLRELVKRWTNHKVMVKWLIKFFHYVDRYFEFRSKVPSLREVALTCFHDLVYLEMHSRARKAVIALILKEREGEEIDRELVKNVLDIYVENGMGTMEKYEEDFEKFMLQDTISYYSLKASKWIQEDSCPDYMLKSEECLERERERVTHYLHSSTEPKLFEALKEAFEILRKEGANEKLDGEFLDWCYISR